MAKFGEKELKLLTNSELIEVLNNTHSARPLFRRVIGGNEQTAWFTSHKNGMAYYAALFNAGETECVITARLPIEEVLSCRELWSHADFLPIKGEVSASVKPHGAVIFKLQRNR